MSDPIDYQPLAARLAGDAYATAVKEMQDIIISSFGLPPHLVGGRMPNDGDYLLAAIIEHPSEDDRRLVYADWLEENGQSERGEFIRLQIALWNECKDCRCGRKGGGHQFTGGQHHNGPCAADQMRIEVPGGNGRTMRAREREVTLRDKLYDIGSFAMFSRGFVSEIHCTLGHWQASGRTLARANPIERVTLTDKRPFVAEDGQRHVWRSDKIDWNEEFAPIISSDSLLPDVLYRHVVMHASLSDVNKGRWVVFPTKQAALDALSAACIVWARRQKGM